MTRGRGCKTRNKTNRIDLKTMDLRKMERGLRKCVTSRQVATSHVFAGYGNIREDERRMFATSEIIWLVCFHLALTLFRRRQIPPQVSVKTN